MLGSRMLHSRCRVLSALFTLLAAGFALSAGAAPSFVQGSSQSGNAARSVSTASFASAQSAGNVNVVFVAWQGAPSSLISVVDSVGNAYIKVGAVSYGTTATQAVYYTHGIVAAAAGHNTVTATFNAKVTNPDLRIVEYSGIDPTRPLDASGGQGSAAVLTSSGAVATTNANDLLLASNFSQQSITAAGAGFTQRLKDQYAQIVEDQTVTAVGKYTATAPQTKSGWFLMQLVALRAAAAPPPVAVPNIVGQAQSAAGTALTAAGLKAGTVTTQASPSVASGYVISQSPGAGASAAAGSSVNLVVSSGPAMVSVPNVVALKQSAAAAALTAAQLTLGTVTQQSSVTIAAGSVISESPTAGANVAAGSKVNLVVSSGPAMVSVPNVVGQTQSAASSALTTLGLTVGSITAQSSATVAAGTVITSQPVAGTGVVPGAAVSLWVSSGPNVVTVPNVSGQTQSAASSALTALGLTIGTVTQQTSSTVSAGSVIASTPSAGASANVGAAVNLVVSSGASSGPPPVTVPNVIGQTQSAAVSSLTTLGLLPGTVTQQPSSTVASGSVISSTPAAGANVANGTAINLVVSTGAPAAPPPVTVPSVLGQLQSAASTALTSAGLTVGPITQQSSTTVAAGLVIASTPAAGASVAAGAAVSLLISTGAPANPPPLTNAPYPQSSILAGISWDETSKQRYASGSDIWDSAWASDGFVYGVWGDGNGFSAPAKKQIGVSQLGGLPDAGPITGRDVYLGSPSPRVGGCGLKPTLGGKPHGILALPNAVIYMFHSTYDLCTNFAWLARSLDNGVTWSDNVGGLAWPDANGFNPVAVLQYGAGQTGALMPDATFVPYVYIYGSRSSGAAGAQYLARVPAFPTNAVESLANWSYYAGTDASGNPLWAASSAQATPVWSDANYAESIGVSFDAALGRYIAYNDHGNACGGSPCERQVSLFDAPSPWGPWTTFDYEENFDNANCGGNCLGSQAAVGWAMMQKWFGADGLSLWAEYSSINAYDSLNLIKGTMTLAAGSSIDRLAISTATPAVLDRLSLTGSGNLEFIDSRARWSSIPAAYLGDEVIRLARNDAAVADVGYVSFSNTTAQNVCVAWNIANPLPAWLAGWNATGQSLVGDATFAVYSMAYPAGAVTLPGANAADAYILFVGCY